MKNLERMFFFSSIQTGDFSIFPLFMSLCADFLSPYQVIWGPVQRNRYDSAVFCSSGRGHQAAIALHLSAISVRLFRDALTTPDAPSPLLIQRIAALNVSATLLRHYKLTVAFIKQEMKRGTANIGIWAAVRIPINSRCHCGHVGLSCANERASQLSAWWICVNAVSSWTAPCAGVVASSPSPLHPAGLPVLPRYHRTK